MTKREVVKLVFDGKRPPYVPWNIAFTQEPLEALRHHYGTTDIDGVLGNHMAFLGSPVGQIEHIGNGRYRDAFGAVWDKSVDKDIGVVEGCVLPEPTIAGYRFPDPRAPDFFKTIDSAIAAVPDRFRVFPIGFSLYERAWTLRGMENLMMDMIEHPAFVHELLGVIADHAIEQAEEALQHDIDAVYFGDDWGQQQGLQMGPDRWREFILPQLRRMYGAVRTRGRYVLIHSCGDVDEIFDDLIDAGINCFNPFQPEVMDTDALLARYRGRLAFYGGLSTQKILPFGTPDEVRAESRRLVERGRAGGYIFSPAHAVEGDVPLANILACIEVVQAQVASA